MNKLCSDGLVNTLRRLRDTGSIPLSAVSASSIKSLRPLMDSEVIVKKARGRGVVLQLVRIDYLLKFIDTLYPSGLEETDADSFSRSSSVLWLRNSKRASERSSLPVLIRGFGCSRLVSADGSQHLDVSDLTRSFGVAAVMLDRDGTGPGFEGRVATVENLEVFTEFEKICSEDVLVVYTGGRTSGILLKWLASPPMAAASITHYGDYDPVGLSEYLRIKSSRTGQTDLFIPRQLEQLVEMYGNTELLEKSSHLIPRLRESDDPNVIRVLAALQKKNRALEQEILLEIS